MKKNVLGAFFGVVGGEIPWYRVMMRVLAIMSIILSLMVIEAEATSVTEGLTP